MNHASLFAVVPLLATALAAQDPPPAAVQAVLDKVDAVLGRADGADGDARALRISGTYSITFQGQDEPVGKGPFRELYDGVRGRHHSDMGEYGALERGVTEEFAWEVDPAMGAKVYHDQHEGVVRRFFGVLAGRSPRELYQKFELDGTEQIDGVAHSVLRLTPAKGAPDTWVVAPDGTVARITTALPTPESSEAAFGLDDLMPATLTLGDWRAVGDAKLPHRRDLAMGPATVAFRCSEIAVVESIDADAFTPPKAIAELVARGGGEAKPAFDADGKVHYDVGEVQEQLVASIRVKIKPSEVSEQLAILLPEVMAHLNATGAQMAGAPFSRYHSFGPDEIEIEAGIPIRKRIEEKGRVKNSKLPGGKAVSCWHVGPYHGLSKAHADLTGYLRKNSLKQRGGPWEIYWTDPGMVPDEKKWRTQLFAPIE